jgi:hypothetical protein
MCVIFFALPLQECLHKRASILRYAYIACLIKISFIHFTYFTNILQWQYCNRSGHKGSRRLLGAFAKLRKATIASSCLSLSVCQFVHVKQLGSHRKYFREILYLSIFRHSVEKIQVSLKFEKHNGRFISRPIHMYDHISFNYLRMRNGSDNVVEKFKKHVL